MHAGSHILGTDEASDFLEGTSRVWTSLLLLLRGSCVRNLIPFKKSKVQDTAHLPALKMRLCVRPSANRECPRVKKGNPDQDPSPKMLHIGLGPGCLLPCWASRADRTVILPGHRKADLLEAAGKMERAPGALTEPSTQGTVSPRHSRIGVLLSDIFLLYNLNRELVTEESTDYIFFKHQ